MSKVAFFLDIDDCLIKTTTLTKKHLDTLKKSLKEKNIPHAAEITREFAATFNRIYAVHQGKKLSDGALRLLKNDLTRLEELEKPIIAKYGEIKVWSREVYLYMIGQKYGIKLSNNNLIYISNAFWKTITQNATFYPDTLPFLHSLQDRKIPFYLITSSDCRLTLDEKNGLFNYDPDYSRKLKLDRLDILYGIGIKRENIFVADPYDKPNPWVFKKALEKAHQDAGEKFTGVMIGDSVKNDLLPAKRAGVEKLIWLKRGSAKEDQTKDIVILNSFQDLLSKI